MRFGVVVLIVAMTLLPIPAFAQGGRVIPNPNVDPNASYPKVPGCSWFWEGEYWQMWCGSDEMGWYDVLGWYQLTGIKPGDYGYAAE